MRPTRRHQSQHLLAVFAGTLLLAACPSEPWPLLRGSPPGAHPKHRRQLRVGTYNAGLAPGDIAYVDERLPEIASALGEQRLDLICLQEVWRQEDYETLSEAIAERFPNQVRSAPDAECAQCSPVELDPLGECIEASCADAVDGDLVGCAVAVCGGDVEQLSGGCAGCLIGAATDGRSFGEVRDACVGGGGDGVASYLYDCSFDTALATSLEVVDSASLVLDSYLVRSAVEYARVESDMGEVDVFCTHLASSIGEFEYRGDFEDWEAEQLNQIELLLEFVDAKSALDGVAIVLGDLNTAPAIEAAGIPARWPDHYQRLVDAGFDNPYVRQDDVACTSCPDNTFREGQGPRLVDHILIRGHLGPTDGSQFMTERVEIEVGGATIETNLSDHNGLELELEAK